MKATWRVLRSDFRGTIITVGPRKERMQLWSLATEKYVVKLSGRAGPRTSSEIDHILDSHWLSSGQRNCMATSPMVRLGRCYGRKIFNKHRAIGITQFFEYPDESWKAAEPEKYFWLFITRVIS